MTNDISVFTQPNCLPCKRVMRKLEEAGVPFDVYDISENEFAYEFVKELGAKSTPVITIDGRAPIVGYQPDQLKDLIIERTSDQIHDYVYEGDE